MSIQEEMSVQEVRIGASPLPEVDIEGTILDEREAGIFRVHRSAFVSDAVLARERERIFDRTWLFAGHASEVPNPGDFVTRDVAGRPLIIVHGDDGQVRAFMNTCRHRGNIVCREGRGRSAEVLRCFYHGWIYSTQGDLIGVPGEDAYSDAFDRDELGLAPAPRTENYRGCIFVSFDPNIEGLVEYLADAKEILDNTLDMGDMEFVAGQQKYSMRANWKLLVENSMDGYHAAFTHERYLTFLQDMDVPVNATIPTLAGAPASESGAPPVMRQASPLGNGHVTSSLPRPRTGPRQGSVTTAYLYKNAADALDKQLETISERHGYEKATQIEGGSGNYLIFPNLIVIDGWRTFRTFYPSSPDYMEINAWACMPKEDTPELRKARLEAFLTFLGPGGFATPDDVEALEGCGMGFAASKEVEWNDISRGMKTGGTAGELQMRVFWREWYARMTTGGHADNYAD